MAGKSLTVQTPMQCPHGGTVTATSANTNVVDGAGAALLLQSDTCTVSGCPFQIPAPSGTVPSPCVTVQWVMGDVQVTINGTPTLSESSVGLCISAMGVPQGTVMISGPQQKVESR
jgi:hypothetical protein